MPPNTYGVASTMPSTDATGVVPGVKPEVALVVELEDVELGARPDVDERERAGSDVLPVRRRRVEHVLVEASEAVRVVGQDRDVVDAVEQHHANSGITCLPSSSIECMTLSWGILYGFSRQNNSSQPTAS